MVKKKKSSEEITKFTKYERARMIGSRALQLSMGAPFLIKLSKKELETMRYDPLEIAKEEFKKGALPLVIRRSMPKNASEEA